MVITPTVFKRQHLKDVVNLIDEKDCWFKTSIYRIAKNGIKTELKRVNKLLGKTITHQLTNDTVVFYFSSSISILGEYYGSLTLEKIGCLSEKIEDYKFKNILKKLEEIGKFLLLLDQKYDISI